MANYTPMIQQYLQIKHEYPDAFLFFRLGDFYELFFEDATLAAQELEITLTSRAGGKDEKIPMCGVPYHSSTQYIRKLIDKGYKVAICEQVEDPKQAKGVVKREVVQVITPGTLMDETMLNGNENNYILFLARGERNGHTLIACDLSTGEVSGTEAETLDQVADEALQYRAKEVVLTETYSEQEVKRIQTLCRCSVSRMTCPAVDRSMWPASLRESVEQNTRGDQFQHNIQLMISYLNGTQKRTIEHLKRIRFYEPQTYLKLDMFSRRNLEITETIRDHRKKGSLLWLLDATATAMGSRLLKRWLARPLIDRTAIEQRLQMVESLVQHAFEREEVRDELQEVYDLERLAGRVSYGNVNPRDLLQLKRSLQHVPNIFERVLTLPISYLHELIRTTDACQDVADLLEKSIHEDAPLTLKEGGIFKSGYHDELDRLQEARKNGKRWIAELEAVEKERTGIKSLKVGFNKVFGYYIEVTKANLHLLPEDGYERKQTLANAERFITPELKEKEALILQAEERLFDLEYELFLELRERINESVIRLQRLAELIAQLDVLCAFATVSEKYHYVRPTFNDEKRLKIKQGRHPVVEKVLAESSFIANDVNMDQEQRQILLITGPNMAGKSTYMRQTALIVIMAQIGCFVPADEASLPIFDQIFTRIGAADDLVGGQSTFMVEMLETQRAITQATENSLILLDEIGRGTSTYDGMSLAQAVVEHIHNHVRAKTLFSTHYHELTALEGQLDRVKNVHVACTERQGKVIFLHKVKEGRADRSYGIHVAQLAQMPDSVIQRANEILVALETAASRDGSKSVEIQSIEPRQERNDHMDSKSVHAHKTDSVPEQLSFFDYQDERQEIITRIESLNLLTMTPLEALNTLHELQSCLQKLK